jgi:tRNA dimethylallyltransferase
VEKNAIDAVLIAGPTASGKSSVALELAQKWSGWVINADSMQVYGDLRILSARPDETDMARAPHKLFGHVSVTSPYSVGHWLDEARVHQKQSRSCGALPIFVGGTGLYFRALTEGLMRLPDIPDAVRSHWRLRLNEVGAPGLYRVLAGQDPDVAARLSARDGQRIVRALEVLDATGKSLDYWRDRSGRPPVVKLQSCLKIVLAPDRAWLHERINGRFDQMMAAGGWEEAGRLAEMDLDPELPAAKAIGVREILRALRGEVDRKQAVDDAKTATRRYAKRQETWFRHQMADWPRLRAPVDRRIVDHLAATLEFPLDQEELHD